MGYKLLGIDPYLISIISFYPKHIALHSLLGYFWSICDDKLELVDAYDAVGFISPGQKERALGEIYTKDKYEAIRESILGGAFAGDFSPKQEEEFTFAGYARDIYESDFPELLVQGRPLVPPLHDEEGSSYPDCAETSIRNFFNILTYARGGNFQGELLAVKSPKMDQIRKFYGTFSTQSSQLSQDARDAWSNILINLNDSPRKDLLTVNDVKYRGKEAADELAFSNIAGSAGQGGIVNVLNVFAKLTDDDVLKLPWLEVRYPEQIEQKLNRLCQIFSRDGFVLDWNIDEDKMVDYFIGKLTFLINGRKSFVFDFRNAHMGLNMIPESTDDWRKRDLTHRALYFTDPFFVDETQKTPFLRKDIERNSLFSVLEYWREQFSGRNFDHPSIIASLRSIKKFYGNDFSEQATVEVLKLLASLFKGQDQMDSVFRSLKPNVPLQEWVNMIWKNQPNVVLDFYFSPDINQDSSFARAIVQNLQNNETFIKNTVQYLMRPLPDLRIVPSVEESKKRKDLLTKRKSLWGFLKTKIKELAPEVRQKNLGEIDGRSIDELLFYAFENPGDIFAQYILFSLQDDPTFMFLAIQYLNTPLKTQTSKWFSEETPAYRLEVKNRGELTGIIKEIIESLPLERRQELLNQPHDPSLFNELISIDGVFNPGYIFADGSTWLHQAALVKNAEIFDRFLGLGVPVNIEANDGIIALDLSMGLAERETIGSIRDQFKVVSKTLLKKCFDGMLKGELFNFAYIFRDGTTWLHQAVFAGNTDIISFLLNQGISIDVKANELTALDYALIENYSKGIKPNMEMAKFLIENGANPAVVKTPKALFDLLRSGTLQERKARDLIAKTPVFEDGRTWIYQAVLANDSSIIPTLVNFGAQINETFNDKTPLEYCVEIRTLVMAQVLIQNGADVNRLDSQGLSPLYKEYQQSCRTNQWDLFEFMLNNGGLLDSEIKPNIQTGDETPMTIKVKIISDFEPQGIIYLIQKKVLDPNGTIAEESLLKFAISKGSIQVVKCLIENGANLYEVGVMRSLERYDSRRLLATFKTAFKPGYDLNRFSLDDKKAFESFLKYNTGHGLTNITLSPGAAEEKTSD